jgi:hypothetical protein
MPRPNVYDLMPTSAKGPATRPQPPASLSPSARKLFLDIVVAEPHLRGAHGPLLAQYCVAVTLAESAAAELQRPDADALWLLRWEKATRAMATFALRLKLCPQAPRLPDQPVSAYDRIALDIEGERRAD